MPYIRIQRPDKHGTLRELYVDISTVNRESHDFFQNKHPEAWTKVIRTVEGILFEALLKDDESN